MSLIAVGQAQPTYALAQRVSAQAALVLKWLRGGMMIDDLRTVIRSGLLDIAWYRQVARRPSSGLIGLARHYLDTGHREGLDPNLLFDTDWYFEQNRREIGDENPLLHYLRSGWRTRCDPHPLFSIDFYLNENPDVRRADREPLAHFLEYGFREGRSPSKEFDIRYYLQSNPDVAAAGVNPLFHFIEYGAAEGRCPTPSAATASGGPAALRRLPPARRQSPSLARLGRDRSIAMDSLHSVSQEEYARWIAALSSRSHKGEGPHSRPVFSVMRFDSGAGRIWSDTLKEASAATSVEGNGRHFVLVCDKTDEIDTDLLALAAEQIGNKRDLAIFDFVVASACGSRWHPILLPGPNHTLISAVDATSSRFIISADLMRHLAGLKPSCPYDMLRAAITDLRQKDDLSRFVHVPLPLIRARSAAASGAPARAEREGSRRKAAKSSAEASARGQRDVSVVICTKDRCLLLTQLLESLLRQSPTLLREILVVTNAEANSYARSVHRRFKNERRITFLDHQGPYNFSIQCNYGARRARGSHLLFLNDDIVPIGTEWLGELCEPLERVGVGVSGPLLLYPDERAQHAGMYLGFNGCAGHALRGAQYPSDEYLHTLTAPRNVSLVTGAALLTDAELFKSLNGFDRQLGTYLQDVDYCLRVRNSGHEIVYQPAARLFHMESISMGDALGSPVFHERRVLEHKHFERRWGAALASDRFHNPNLDVADETWKTITLAAA